MRRMKSQRGVVQMDKLWEVLGECEHIIGRGLVGSVCWLLNDLPLLTLSCSMVVFVSPGYYRGPYFFMNAYLFF
jgi:hypothetical protein